MVAVRQAKPEDLPRILDLLNQVKGDTQDLAPHQFKVAEAGGKVIGCGRLKTYEGLVELSSMAIAEGLRGGGLGRELMDGLLHEVSAPVYLICNDQNVPYYERFGFQPIDKADTPPALVEKYNLCQTVLDSINIMVRWPISIAQKEKTKSGRKKG